MHVFVRAAVSGVGGAQHVRIGRHRRRRDVLQQERGQCQRVLQIDKPERRQLGRVVALAVRVQMSRAGRIDHFRGAAAGRRRLGGRETARRHCSGGPTDAEPLEGAGRRQSLPVSSPPGRSLFLPFFRFPGPRRSRPASSSRFSGASSLSVSPQMLHRPVSETAARRCCCCCCRCSLPGHQLGGRLRN